MKTVKQLIADRKKFLSNNDIQDWNERDTTWVAKEYASQAIDEAAEKAECKNEGTYGGDGESMDYYVVDKQSILKVKNELR